MGRQFRFYLLPSDIDRVLAELRGSLPMRLIGDVSACLQPMEIQSPFERVDPKQKSRIPSSVYCYLISSDEPDVRMWYMCKRQLWAVDDERSEVMEFSGCDFSGTVLDIGRFYYRADMLLDMSIWPKRAEFVSWAEKVFRTTKRMLKYSPNLAAYVGEDAAKWKREGGMFGSIRPDGRIVNAGDP